MTVGTRPAFLAIALALSVVRVADAQPSQASAAATAQFEQGRRLMKEGKYKEACEAFAASQRLEAAPGTLYNLAGCYVQIGRLATAHEAYYKLSHSDPNAGRRADAAARAAALAPRVPKLVIKVAAAPAGLRVLLDGQDVTVAAGTELPVDLGLHQIVVTAPGHLARETSTTIVEEGKTVALEITLEPAPAPVVEPAPDVSSGQPPSGAPPGRDAGPQTSAKPEPAAAPTVVVIRDESDDSPGRGRKILGVVTMLVGGAAVAAGLKFGYDAQSTWDEVKMTCGDDLVCDSNPQYVMAEELVDEAQVRANISTGLVIGGAVAITGGLLLVLTAPSGRRTSASGVRLEPGAAGSPAGVSLRGWF